MIKRPLRRTHFSKSHLPKKGKPVIGWREWAVLPDLSIPKIKAKIDTGARTSSLHAYDVTVYRRHNKEYVKFKINPIQRNTKKVVECDALLLEWRQVTDSGGRRTLRPVIETRIMMGAREVLAEVTLIARDQMGFRMLIGRQALKQVLVDPTKSYIASEGITVAKARVATAALDEEE
jgi:hypothetical protein